MSVADVDPTVETPNYPMKFAQLLTTFRGRTGMTVRELAALVGYSHSQIVRAEQGVRVPTWPVASTYLAACGVGHQAMTGWRILWEVARSAQTELRRYPGLTAESIPFWAKAGRDWRAGQTASSGPDPLHELLRDMAHWEEFGAAIRVLAERSGLVSIRDIALRCGVPKSTMHRWLIGTRRPSNMQLEKLVAALGATPTVRAEFAEAFRRVTESCCGEPHPQSGLACVRDDRHRGWHSTAMGVRWLDDGSVPAELTVAERYFDTKLDRAAQ
ncbi:helix-turn-helix domain-containing protein [Kribbella sp. NPDC004536]|uniref:helix-turn-helix domain-containing protein n=1 Tax=Kribbella sp. NPDC004536 TaxID=3364106 RepID=UPI003674D3C1